MRGESVATLSLDVLKDDPDRSQADAIGQSRLPHTRSVRSMTSATVSHHECSSSCVGARSLRVVMAHAAQGSPHMMRAASQTGLRLAVHATQSHELELSRLMCVRPCNLPACRSNFASMRSRSSSLSRSKATKTA